MALIEKLVAIANGFRSSRGTSAKLSLDEMAVLAAEPVGSTAPVVEPLTVTENGTYTAPSGVDGYNPVTVNVAGSGGSEMEEQWIRTIEGYPDKPVTKLPDAVTYIRAYAFYESPNLMIDSIPAGVTDIDQWAFYWCNGLTEITFKGTPGYIDIEAFSGCSNLLTINVPWAEGEVGNAPWGADYATINYNYTGG